MVANITPVFGLKAILTGEVSATAANTTKDLSSGTIYLIYTAQAADGGLLERIRFEPRGTNVVTVARIFSNNGGVTSTAANNLLIGQVLLPATTLSEVAVNTMQPVDWVFNGGIPAGYRVYVVLATAVAAGYQVSAFARDWS